MLDQSISHWQVIGGFILQVDGNRPKDQVFADIKNMIMELQGEPEKVGAQVASGGLRFHNNISKTIFPKNYSP